MEGVKNQPIVHKVRADVLLAGMYPQYSRAALAKLFDKNLVTVAGRVVKSGDKFLSDAQIVADVSSLEGPAEDIDLPILYEDDDCIVLNKPEGVLTHALGKHGNEPSVASFIRTRLLEDGPLVNMGLASSRAGV